VRLYTARSVELAPYQDVLGQVAEGFEASFIILDRDIFTIDVEEIDQTVVRLLARQLLHDLGAAYYCYKLLLGYLLTDGCPSFG
jgi:hypothetical protein